MPAPGRADLCKSLLLIAGLSAIVGLCIWLQWWWAQTSLDVSVYWEAGARMRAGGQDLYAPSVDPANHVGHFIYPPLFATLYAPLTWLPRWLGYGLWTLLELGLLVATYEGARRLTGVQQWAQRRDLALWLLLALWGAIWMNMVEGQVNLLIGALVCWGLHWIEQKKTWRGALLLAAAIHIKVVPLVLLPVLVVQGRWRAALASVVCAGLLWLAPLVWTVPAFGIAGGMQRNVALTSEYRDVIAAPRLKTQSSDLLGGVREPNNGLPALWQRYFSKGQRLSNEFRDLSPLVVQLPETPARWGGLVIAALMGCGAMFAAWWRRNDQAARATVAGMALVCGMLANLLFWPHHMCASVLLLAPLWTQLAGFKRWAVALALMVFAWLPVNDQTPTLAWMGAWGTPTWAILGVWGVAMWKTLKPSPLQATSESLYSRAHEETTRNSTA
ncbi:MAG: DUF2029 domain-containing protein [Planctomycetes bacterium]|nr:DUF2029 domain-containing protein [Planctomycetota bacterium]